ncbi:MAG: hypothetical protein Q9194_006033, partial [Teloschistes cf. exilis]
MPVELDSPHRARVHDRSGHVDDEKKKKKKRKRTDEGDTESPLTRKKHRSKKDSRPHDTQVPRPEVSIPAIPIGSSPFHLQRSSLYLPLPPIAQAYPLQGLCAEHLSPLILTYYPPLRGTILSYHDARLATTPQQETTNQEAVLARAIDEYAAPHVWVTAEFLLFKPEKGDMIEGWINLQNEGNIGLVCWNFFNASIERKRLPRTWKWKAGNCGAKASRRKLKGSEKSGPVDVDQGEGSADVNGVDHIDEYFEDGDGRMVTGLIQFRVKDIETSRNYGGDHNFLSIKGTLLDEAEEQELCVSDTRQVQPRGRRHQEKGNGVAPLISGALVSREEEAMVNRRHGLPSARIIWATDLINVSAATTGSETTISQLLEQVNDIIPLESTDWGLEDYTIEVGGFECLHFSQASRVLKEDDNVTIRPLNTSDLRFRKVSGRHQISADGKHLIDGVAFGRPFLRRAERPSIRIPPRKRRRLTYDEVSDDEALVYQQQLVVRNDSDNEEDSDADSDSDYRESEVLEAAKKNDNDIELVEVLADSDAVQEYSPNAIAIESSHPDPPRRRPSRVVNGLGLRASSLLVDEDGKPFPGDYDNPLLDFFADDELSQGQDLTASVRKERKQPTTTSQRHQNHHSEIVDRTRPAETRKKSRTEGKTVRFEEAELATPATVQLGASNDPDDSNDPDFEPFEDENEEVSESDKENATPGARIRACHHDIAVDSEQTSSSESESDSDETSSSGSSGSDTSSSEGEDEDFAGEFIRSKANQSESSSSDTSSSSGSSSGSKKFEAPSKTKTSKQAATACLPPAKSPSLNHLGSQQPVSPGAGRRRTQARNRRRKEQKKQKKLLSLQKAHETPSKDDVQVIRTDRADEVQADAGIQDEAMVDQNDAAQFEAKKKALLQAISSGDVDTQDNRKIPALQKVLPKQSSTAPQNQMVMQRANAGKAVVEKSTSSASERMLVDTSFSSKPDPSDGIIVDPVDESEVVKDQTGVRSLAHNEEDGAKERVSVPLGQKPRMRLDMDSSRRLLFGALGHRAPKTKDGETLLQAKLTRDAKSSKMPPYMTTDEGSKDQPAPSEDFDSWKDKIELSAVECCHEGIELSTPPFPFVQRWDPQQQMGYFAKQQGPPPNSKKRKRNNKHYEASVEPHEESEAASREHMPSYGIEQRFEDDDNDAAAAECDIEPAEQTSDENGKAASDQLLRETEETVKDAQAVSDAAENEDLPTLPDDPSTYPNLERNGCTAGAIIAFKQLDMSAETKWAPVISEYRTALIDGVLDDGTLSLRMALQDIPQQEKQYDEETGERVYSKFEMPGYGETDSDEDNGMLELAFADLIEPKLVRAVEEARQPSKVDEVLVDATPIDHEVTKENITMAMTGGQHEAPPEDIVQDSANGIDHLPDDAEVREEFRKEFKDLMKEAGWHSSIQSNGSFPKDPSETPQTAPDHQSMQASLDASNLDGPSSPHFDGFNSSPPAEEYQEVVDEILYPTLKSPSSPTAVQYETTMDLDKDHTMGDLSSQADREAMRALREDFEKEMLQPVHPHTDSDPGNSEQDSSRPSSRPQSSAIAPQPARSISPPPARRNGNWKYSSLISTIPDSQPQLQQASNLTTTSYEPPSSSSDHDFEPRPTDRSFSSDDDDELPSLQSVMTSFSSQRQASQASIAIKAERYSDDEDANTSPFLHNLPSQSKTSGKNTNSKDMKSKSFDPEPTKAAKTDNDAYKPPPSSSASARLALHQKTNKNAKPSNPPPRLFLPKQIQSKKNEKEKEKEKKKKKRMDKRYDPAPPSTQDYIGTQVVDLTVSSDPVTLEEEEEEMLAVSANGSASGNCLPKGPGWVTKMKAKKG